MIELCEGINKDRKQRMTLQTVERSPFRKRDIGKGIVARKIEIFHEKRVVTDASAASKLLKMLIDSESVQGRQIYENCQCRPAFLFSYVEYA